MVIGEEGEADRGRLPFALVPPLDLDDSYFGEQRSEQVPVLGQRLFDLLDAAGLCAISIEARAGWSGHSEQFRELEAAAQGFELAPDLPLADRFWTGLRALYGDVPAQVLDDASGRNRRATGIVMLTAPRAGLRGAYFEKGSPLAVRDGLLGSFTAGGPYLILLECEADGMGRLAALRGFAQAVLGDGWLLPVAAELERDVLKVLLAVQERLDSQGIETRISRRHSCGKLTREITFEIVEGPVAMHEKVIICCESGPSVPVSAGDSFHIGSRQIADGSLVNWLLGATWTPCT